MSQHARSTHLATIAHAGRIWDAYLEQEGDPAVRDVVRARVRFSSPEVDHLYRTAAIIIEASWEEAVARAHGLDERQLSGLLRSVLPDPDEEGGPPPEQQEGPESDSGPSSADPSA